MNLKIGFCKLDDRATIPSKAHEDDLGFDLHCLEDVTISANNSKTTPAITKVRTGVAARFPGWCGGLIRDRSGISTKNGIFIVAGVIDPQYTGEIIVAFYNSTFNDVTFKAGDRIAQMLIMPVIPVEVEEIDDDMMHETTRGARGFGSTGI